MHACVSVYVCVRLHVYALVYLCVCVCVCVCVWVCVVNNHANMTTQLFFQHSLHLQPKSTHGRRKVAWRGLGLPGWILKFSAKKMLFFQF